MTTTNWTALAERKRRARELMAAGRELGIYQIERATPLEIAKGRKRCAAAGCWQPFEFYCHFPQREHCSAGEKPRLVRARRRRCKDHAIEYSQKFQVPMPQEAATCPQSI